MGRISPGPTRWTPGAERRVVPAKSNLKPQTSPGLYLTVLCLLRRNLALCCFRLHAAVYFILALDSAPHTSLATFVCCPSRVRGVTCNILVLLPPYPHLFVFCVLRRRRTPYARGCAGAGVLHPTCMVSYLRYVSTVARFVTYFVPSLLTAYRVVLVAALFIVAWHTTYLCFGGRWRCC